MNIQNGNNSGANGYGAGDLTMDETPILKISSGSILLNSYNQILMSQGNQQGAQQLQINPGNSALTLSYENLFNNYINDPTKIGSGEILKSDFYSNSQSGLILNQANAQQQFSNTAGGGVPQQQHQPQQQQQQPTFIIVTPSSDISSPSPSSNTTSSSSPLHSPVSPSHDTSHHSSSTYPFQMPAYEQFLSQNQLHQLQHLQQLHQQQQQQQQQQNIPLPQPNLSPSIESSSSPPPSSSSSKKLKRDFNQLTQKDEWDNYFPPYKTYRLFNSSKHDLNGSFNFKVKRIDKNIQYSDLDSAWILYRQNRFQVDCDLSGSLESWSNTDRTGLLFSNIDGKTVEISGLYFTLYVLKFTNSQSTHSPNDQSERVPIHQLGSSSGKKDGRLPVEPCPVAKGKANWTKLQFGSATANNARVHPDQPNPNQQFFRIVVTLNAVIADSSTASNSPNTFASTPIANAKFIPIQCKISPPMIVRGQNPGRFLNQDKSSKKDNSSSPRSESSNKKGNNSSYLEVPNVNNSGKKNELKVSTESTESSDSSDHSMVLSNTPATTTTTTTTSNDQSNLTPLNLNTTIPMSVPLPTIPNVNISTVNNNVSNEDENWLNHNNHQQHQQHQQQQHIQQQQQQIIDNNQNNIIANYFNTTITSPFEIDSNSFFQLHSSGRVYSSSLNNQTKPQTQDQASLFNDSENGTMDVQPMVTANTTTTTSTTTGMNKTTSDTTATWIKNPFSEEENLIYTNGKVGINTNNPTQALTVNGNILVTGELFKPSDKRIKRNIISDKANHWENIDKLKIYEYDRLKMKGYDDNSGDKSHFVKEKGFLAQEVKEVLPHAVKYAGDVKLQDGTTVPNLMVVNDRVLLLENIGATQQIGKTLRTEQEHIIEMDKEINRVKIEGKRDQHVVLSKMQDLVSFMLSEETKTQNTNIDESCIHISCMGLGPAWTCYVFGFFFPLFWIAGSLFLFSGSRVKWICGLVNFLTMIAVAIMITLFTLYLPNLALSILIPTIVGMGILVCIVFGFFRQKNVESKRKYYRERMRLMKDDGYINLNDHVELLRNDYRRTQEEQRLEQQRQERKSKYPYHQENPNFKSEPVELKEFYRVSKNNNQILQETPLQEIIMNYGKKPQHPAMKRVNGGSTSNTPSQSPSLSSSQTSTSTTTTNESHSVTTTTTTTTSFDENNKK